MQHNDDNSIKLIPTPTRDGDSKAPQQEEMWVNHTELSRDHSYTLESKDDGVHLQRVETQGLSDEWFTPGVMGYLLTLGTYSLPRTGGGSGFIGDSLGAIFGGLNTRMLRHPADTTNNHWFAKLVTHVGAGMIAGALNRYLLTSCGLNPDDMSDPRVMHITAVNQSNLTGFLQKMFENSIGSKISAKIATLPESKNACKEYVTKCFSYVCCIPKTVIGVPLDLIGTGARWGLNLLSCKKYRPAPNTVPIDYVGNMDDHLKLKYKQSK